MLEFTQIAIGGLVVGCIYAVIALGFSLVFRVTGAINLSQGGFALIAAMIGYTLGVDWAWPLLLAMRSIVQDAAFSWRRSLTAPQAQGLLGRVRLLVIRKMTAEI